MGSLRSVESTVTTGRGRLALCVLTLAGLWGCQGRTEADATDCVGDAAAGCPPTSAALLTPGAEAAAQVAVATLAALSDGDEMALRELVHPSAVLTSLANDPSAEPRLTDMEQFVTGVSNSEVDLLERMWNPTVLVDGRLATVWTPYDFYRDGEFSHCGTDVFQMMHDGSNWRVLSITYTVQREDCGESPLGPPA